jgi:predicted nuclease of predicted toxin-antitoxin system
MKLLFDQNLSFKLCQDIADLFDGSEHVRDLGLTEADDRAIWSYAQEHAFMIVSQDADFADMAILLGSPPPKWSGFGRAISRERRLPHYFGCTPN